MRRHTESAYHAITAMWAMGLLQQWWVYMETGMAWTSGILATLLTAFYLVGMASNWKIEKHLSGKK